MVTYTEPQTVQSYMSVKCTRRTLRMPNFTRAPHAQPSLSNFPRWDSNFGEPTHSRGTTNSDEIFQLPPKIKVISINSQPFPVGIVSLQAIDAYRLGATGSSAHILKFSLQSALFSLCMAMRNHFSMFWFALFIFRVLKCEVVIFDKYCSADVNSMSISNFWHATFT